jgi:hypothetical protein
VYHLKRTVLGRVNVDKLSPIGIDWPIEFDNHPVENYAELTMDTIHLIRLPLIWRIRIPKVEFSRSSLLQLRAFKAKS